MGETITTRKASTLRAFSLVITVLALIGWGTFAYAAKSCATVQQQLNEEVGELKVSQGQLIAERDQARVELTEAKAGMDQLRAERDEANAQLLAARDEVAVLQKRLEEAQAKVAETGSVRAPTSVGKPSRSAPTKRTRR